MMQFFDIIKARFSPKHFWGKNDITFYLSHKIYKFNFSQIYYYIYTDAFQMESYIWDTQSCIYKINFGLRFQKKKV